MTRPPSLSLSLPRRKSILNHTPHYLSLSLSPPRSPRRPQGILSTRSLPKSEAGRAPDSEPPPLQKSCMDILRRNWITMYIIMKITLLDHDHEVNWLHVSHHHHHGGALDHQQAAHHHCQAEISLDHLVSHDLHHLVPLGPQVRSSLEPEGKVAAGALQHLHGRQVHQEARNHRHRAKICQVLRAARPLNRTNLKIK